MSQLDDRIQFRCSSDLRRLIGAAGDESAVIRAALILGLAASGLDVSTFHGELASCLGKLTHPSIHTAALACLRGDDLYDKCTTNVRQTATEPVTTEWDV